MPSIAKWDGYRQFMFSNENASRDDLLVCIAKGKGVALFKIFPNVRLHFSIGFERTELRTLYMLMSAFEGEMEKSWYDYYS